MLRQVEMNEPSILPCVTVISGFYCVIKGNNLVTIGRSSTETSNIPFNPVQWSDSIVQLGTKFIRPKTLLNIPY